MIPSPAIAMQSARIVLVKGDLNGIVRARLLSGAVMRNIRQNLFFAFVYNAAGVPIAAGALYPLTGWLLKSDHRLGGDGVVVGTVMAIRCGCAAPSFRPARQPKRRRRTSSR